MSKTFNSRRGIVRERRREREFVTSRALMVMAGGSDQSCWQMIARTSAGRVRRVAAPDGREVDISAVGGAFEDMRGMGLGVSD